MLNKVRTQPYMTFVGLPGSRKSATIYHIALILQKEGYEVVPVKDISEIYRYCDSHNPQVFVIDDVVCQALIEVLETKSYTGLKSLFLSEQKDVSKVVSKRERVREESENRDGRSREWHRQEVLVNERIKEEDHGAKTYSVRVINLEFKYVLGDTVLWAASTDGHLSVVKELVEAGADVNPRKVFETPLTAAMKELIEAGADINQKGQCFYSYTPLIAACKDGYISIVKELLGARADVNLQGKHGISIDNETPLTVACKGGHFEIAKELLEAGAGVNQRSKCDTPLTAACEGGHVNLVQELLKAGAYINVHSEIDSPLTAAIKGGNIIIAKQLLRAGPMLIQKIRMLHL
ncbi:kinase D-interacting substrate of 220 kDa-like [Saccostrea cucullata]|uniref:kinase D-interacting substrate of 220 kDa-like n=1 Tax=Saccostrea cuccullata TaxID=36930 RepID=UPI002ED20F27